MNTKGREKPIRKSLHLKGIAAAPGIAMGQAFVLEKSPLQIPQYWIPVKELNSEIQRFQESILKINEDFLRIKERLCKYEGQAQIHILESYGMILQDELLVQNTIDHIKSEHINAEWALQKTLTRIKSVFSNFEESYFRERQSDIDYIGQKIIEHLVVGNTQEPMSNLPLNSILVAQDLSPAETSELHKYRIKGFVTEVGGETSHTAIVSRAMHLPAVLGCKQITQKIKNGETLILDGEAGIVILHPGPEELAHYQSLQKESVQADKKLLKQIHLPTETLDHFRLHLLANIELVEEIDSLKMQGAEGIGLFRTEFLFLNRAQAPSEEEQFQIYKKVVESVYPLPATIRTLDIGADKIPTQHKYKSEPNPALGLRAIRFCLKEKTLFKAQLRALLRASVFGRLKVMLPMISSLSEVAQVKKLLEEIKEELSAKKIDYDPHLPLGVMVETPSAVILAREIAREVDFLSIGTNDLIQYSLAVDRINEGVAHLYKPLHPTVLRLMKMTVQAAQEAHIPVGVCGEMASSPWYILILLGLGFSQLSMNALSIPRVKGMIRALSFREAKAVFEHALTFEYEQDLESFVRKELKRLVDVDALKISRI
ncbi:MAG: phosphoenolpyruvate--protein phosphotransferase [Deltaproteobacteria bacterium]|nr:phosphoenolpyruvate--protein phosphotransferase [Deltaproteobacteria bacterium]